jgi:hypothetical protein
VAPIVGEIRSDQAGKCSYSDVPSEYIPRNAHAYWEASQVKAVEIQAAMPASGLNPAKFLQTVPAPRVAQVTIGDNPSK